jgi:hypothetical protein
MSSVYKSGPSKFNPVSLLLLAGLGFGIYSLVRFGPPYWTQWQYKESLRSACATLYQMRAYEPEQKNEQMQKLTNKLLADLKNLGIDDPEATVELDDSQPGQLIARASYHITVTHPVGRPTVMHFTPEARMDSAQTGN